MYHAAMPCTHWQHCCCCCRSRPAARVGIYSHFWLLLHEYTLLYMYTYMYIDIQRIQYTDSMAPSFVKFCQVYHAFARAHTTVYLGPILLLHEYTLHSYTTKYTLHYVYSHPDAGAMPRSLLLYRSGTRLYGDHIPHTSPYLTVQKDFFYH